MEKNIDGLILKLFNKIINSDIKYISSNNITYKIKEEEIILEIYYRSEKEPEHTKMYNLEDLHKCLFSGPFNWSVFEDNKDSLNDFYIVIKGKSYFVPRPSLKTYAEWLEILEEKIKKYELDYLVTLAQ